MKNRLPQILKEKSISITDLSKKTKIGRTTLSSLNNSDEMPEKTKLGTLLSICKALNISLNQLLVNDDYSGSYLKWYPVKTELENDVGIIAINISNETNEYQTLFSAITTRDLFQEADLKMGRKTDQLYDKFVSKLRSKGESLPSPTDERFYSEFSEKIMKYPDLSAQCSQQEDEIRNSFFAGNPTRVEKIRLDFLSKADLDKLSQKLPQVYTAVTHDNTQISLSRLAKDLNDENIIELSKQINQNLISKHLNSPETGSFKWSLGTGVYGESRQITIFKKGNTYGNPQAAFTQRAMFGESMISRLLDYV